MKRALKWVLILVFLAVVTVLLVFPLLANTEGGRRQLASSLERAFDRPVSIDRLDVGFFWSSVEVEGLRIENPEGWPEAPMLEARELSLGIGLKEIIAGTLTGSVRGEGLLLHVMRRADGTNLDGMVGGKEEPAQPPTEPAPPEEPQPEEEPAERGGPDVDFQVDLGDSRLVVEDLDKGEKLVLDGVSASMRLTNREGASDTRMNLHVRELAKETLRVRDVDLEAVRAGDLVRIDRIEAKLAQKGRLSGEGRMQIRGGDDWQADLRAQDVALDAEMLPVVALFVPVLAGAQGHLGGSLEAAFSLNGKGVSPQRMRETLGGGGEVHVKDLALSETGVLGRILTMAGLDAKQVDLRGADAEFDLKDGWISFTKLSAFGAEAAFDLKGRVSIDGRLELTADILPLVKQFGGEGRYREVSSRISELPLRIGGTVSAPQVDLPSPEDLVEKAAGGLLDRARKELEDRVK